MNRVSTAIRTDTQNGSSDPVAKVTDYNQPPGSSSVISAISVISVISPRS